MNKEWEKVEIGGVEYAFETIPADQAADLYIDIMDTFGVALTKAWVTITAEGKLSDITNIVTECLPAIDSKKVKPIIRQILPHVFRTPIGSSNGERCTFDHFNGKILDLYKVVIFAARYNYWDFFDALQPPSPTGGEEQNA